jgi:hypothetical protein
MAEFERGENKGGNLVQDPDPLSFGDMVTKTSSTKKRIRRVAEPHIEKRRVHGRDYYYFRRGIDAPVYLGTAERILWCVRGMTSG